MAKQMAENDYKTSSSVIYPLPPSIASDSEFATGTSTTASPTVKQCKEKLVTIDTNQAITGFKAFNNGSGNNRTNIDIITNDGVGEDANVKWAGSIQFKKGNLNVGFCEAMRDSANSSIAQITAHNSVNGQEVYAVLRSVVTSDGNAFATAPNTPANAPDNAIVTKGYADAELNAKADKDIPVIGIPATSGTVTLSDNTVYSGTMTGAMTFTLPAVTNATQYHQIKAMLYLPVVTINWGTTHYISGEAPDVSGAGQYMIYWDYVPALSAWAVGAMKVG